MVNRHQAFSPRVQECALQPVATELGLPSRKGPTRAKGGSTLAPAQKKLHNLEFEFATFEIEWCDSRVLEVSRLQ